MAPDDLFEIMNGAEPPKSANDLMKWSDERCALSMVVLVDERPVAYCGVSDYMFDFLVPWAITVNNLGMSRRRTLVAAIRVWEFLRTTMAGRPFANVTTVNHKRSRTLLPLLGFRFTGRKWVSPAGVEFEWFEWANVAGADVDV
jgi:hypothetical protein